MTSARSDLRPELDGLQPPPRDVALGLRCRLLGGPGVLIASGVFAFGMAFVLILGAGAAPVSTWLLDLRHREAPGWLEAVEPTRYSEGGGDDDDGRPIFRYEYTFETPGGARLRGRSYATDLAVSLPKGRLDPARRPDLVIEYDPGRPASNRIRGARTSPYGPAGLFVLIVPAVALLAAAGGVQRGRRKLRLLRGGTPALATMTACLWTGEDCRETPVAEYKRRMAAIRFPGMGAVVAFARGFRLFWLLGVATILLFGLVVIVGGLIFLCFALTKSTEALPMLFGFLGFGALWVTMGAFLLRAGGAGLFGRKAPARQRAQCVFEFRPPGGEPVRVQGAVSLRPDEAEEPPQPVLYDPADAKRAALLSEVAAGLAVSPSGGWEAPGGFPALLRLATIAVLIAGPILTWLFLPPVVP
jgi:hypothetical protein